MLVLSRKVGESIQIDGDIRVTVTQVRGGRVRLSITAPSGVRVVREEILHKFADLAVQEADLECDRENSQVP